MKVPHRPPSSLTFRDGDFIDFDGTLIRIARTSGEYVVAWNEGRSWGPLPTMRWDPHRPPASNQSERAVLYAATTLATACAEVFQSLRYIDTVTGEPWIFTFTPTRPLRLLNLEGSWAIRNGAAAALAHGDKRITRAWIREVFEQRPGLDGLWAPSTLVGNAVTLFSHGLDAMPLRASQSIAASDPAARVVLEEIADQIGYRI